MLIESKIKIGHDSMFNIHQTNFKSAHLLNKMALVQFQRNSTAYVLRLVNAWGAIAPPAHLDSAVLFSMYVLKENQRG